MSLFTDASSEMIYPLMPAFVTGVLGAGPAFLGLVEGVAETVASVMKLAAGWLSDRAGRRKPLVVVGYGLSTLARPLMAVAAAPWHALAVRAADRVGKGTRGAPRDALLAEVTAPEDRGRAYGFHRAMDHAGATVGPLLASGLLLFTTDVRLVFALSIVPGLAALAFLVLGVRETTGAAPRPAAAAQGAATTGHPRSRGLGAYLAVLALFTLGNSSDAFLLLRAQEAGVALAAVPLLWAFHHVVKTAASTHGGRLSDRMGRRRAIVLGWGIYALSYGGFALATRPLHAWALFALYGLYHAMTEGAERALVADLAEAQVRGRAFGLYHTVTGVLLLPASLVTGFLWQRFGAGPALGFGAALAAAASLALFAFVPETRQRSGPAAA